MKSLKNALIYGFFIWPLPFLVAFVIYPLKISNPALFESIMPVVITIVTVCFAILYFKGLESDQMKEGIILGVMWFLISIFIDLLMFMWGPMKMTFTNYMMDIGLTYLITPAVTIGMGYLVDKK